jgi:hypothetical protein
MDTDFAGRESDHRPWWLAAWARTKKEALARKRELEAEEAKWFEWGVYGSYTTFAVTTMNAYLHQQAEVEGIECPAELGQPRSYRHSLRTGFSAPGGRPGAVGRVARIVASGLAAELGYLQYLYNGCRPFPAA